MTNAERLIALEVEFRLHREATEESLDEMKAQLNTLLSLKSKGQGAFWLATTIFGTSFAVFLSYVVSWFK